MATVEYEPVVRMLAAFGIVAAVAVPIGLGCWRLGRRSTSPSLPTPSADDPVVAVCYLLLFVGFQVAMAMFAQAAGETGLPQRAVVGDEAGSLSMWRSVFGTLLAMPVIVAGWFGFRLTCRSFGTRRSVAWAVAVGVAGWLAVSPCVYAINVGAEWGSRFVGVVPQEHPLVKVAATADAWRAVILFAAAAFATPFAEEVVFRGALLGWLVRRPVWAVVPIGLAAVLELSVTDGRSRLMAAGLLLVQVIGLAAVWHRPGLAAVWATATLFSAVHAGVWPTPVPLFLLGLALGWVAVRTGGLLAGTVLHGLFNAVSLVYLVRG